MKTAVRQGLLAARNALAMEERRRQSVAIVDRLRHLPLLRHGGVLGYHPLGSEVDVRGILEEWAARGRLVALPRVSDGALDLHRWRPGDPMEVSPLRVQEPMASAPAVEPAEVAAVLVPGLGFDRAGHRVGYGRGFYDRLLTRFPVGRRVGVAFDVQVVEALPREPHDAPLGWLVTAAKTHEFPAA